MKGEQNVKSVEDEKDVDDDGDEKKKKTSHFEKYLQIVLNF